eukprot:scaffold6710_cov175-Amphora_coffeaeformis.AAC.3
MGVLLNTLFRTNLGALLFLLHCCLRLWPIPCTRLRPTPFGTILYLSSEFPEDALGKTVGIVGQGGNGLVLS